MPRRPVRPSKFSLNDLCTQQEIAAAYGVSDRLIRRHEERSDYPTCLRQLGRSRIYYWPEIAYFYAKTFDLHCPVNRTKQ